MQPKAIVDLSAVDVAEKIFIGRNAQSRRTAAPLDLKCDIRVDLVIGCDVRDSFGNPNRADLGLWSQTTALPTCINRWCVRAECTRKISDRSLGYSGGKFSLFRGGAHVRVRCDLRRFL